MVCDTNALHSANIIDGLQIGVVSVIRVRVYTGCVPGHRKHNLERLRAFRSQANDETSGKEAHQCEKGHSHVR